MLQITAMANNEMEMIKYYVPVTSDIKEKW